MTEQEQGMFADLLAMAERAERRYWLTPSPDPYGEPVTWQDHFNKWLDMRDECRVFAAELAERETRVEGKQ